MTDRTECKDCTRITPRMARKFTWWHFRLGLVAFTAGVGGGIALATIATRFDWHYPAVVVALLLGWSAGVCMYLLERLK